MLSFSSIKSANDRANNLIESNEHSLGFFFGFNSGGALSASS
jgi:hypothetical protein